MKKGRIFLTCFLALWLGIFLYVDIAFKPHAVYWLYYKIFGYLFIIVANVLNCLEKKYSKWSIFFFGCFWTLLMTNWGYRDIKKYKNNVCLDKFGLEFNSTRQKQGVPILPSGWHERYRFDRFDEWDKSDNLPGHYHKEIDVDSTCTLTNERDYFLLNKSLNGQLRQLDILTEYSQAKRGNSIIFRYDDGDSTRAITKQKADSIFAAEKIKKDY